MERPPKPWRNRGRWMGPIGRRRCEKDTVKGRNKTRRLRHSCAMKFGKWLRRVTDQIMPAWEESFIAYKDLKQQINRIAAIQQQRQQQGSHHRSNIDPAVVAEEMRFVMLFYGEISKINEFFVEEVEGFVIRLQDLRERMALDPDRSGLLRIWQGLVCLHGEMILLENCSSLNCLGLVKIVKKHDKLSNSASLLRFPFVRRLLRQPFFDTEPLLVLVAECLRHLGEVERLLGSIGVADDGDTIHWQADDDRNARIMRSTVVALSTIQHLRNGSSTYGPSSLRYNS